MIETPNYQVLIKQDNCEIRHYAEMITAEVSVGGSNYRNAAEKAFQVLASFIFGNNRSVEKIDMTSPVLATKSEKIAMTAPVMVSYASMYTVSFVMPKKYTINNLPVPIDPNIKIRQQAEHDIAVIKFNSFFNEKKIVQNKDKLTEFVRKMGYRADSDFTVAGYNPPWVPGIFSRNEVMIKVIKIEEHRNEE